MNPNNLHQISSLHRHWKNQATGSAKHLQIQAEDRRAYKEETVTPQRLLRKRNNPFTGR